MYKYLLTLVLFISGIIESFANNEQNIQPVPDPKKTELELIRNNDPYTESLEQNFSVTNEPRIDYSDSVKVKEIENAEKEKKELEAEQIEIWKKQSEQNNKDIKDAMKKQILEMNAARMNKSTNNTSAP